MDSKGLQSSNTILEFVLVTRWMVFHSLTKIFPSSETVKYPICVVVELFELAFRTHDNTPASGIRKDRSTNRYPRTPTQYYLPA